MDYGGVLEWEGGPWLLLGLIFHLGGEGRETRITDFVGGKIQDGENGVGVGLVTVDLDGATEERLREDQVGEFGEIEELGVDVEELPQEGFNAVEVNGGLGVKPFKVYVDDVHILGEAGLVGCREGAPLE